MSSVWGAGSMREHSAHVSHSGSRLCFSLRSLSPSPPHDERRKPCPIVSGSDFEPAHRSQVRMRKEKFLFEHQGPHRSTQLCWWERGCRKETRFIGPGQILIWVPTDGRRCALADSGRSLHVPAPCGSRRAHLPTLAPWALRMTTVHPPLHTRVQVTLQGGKREGGGEGSRRFR